jgi:predicted nucleic acid-binding protein
MIFIDTNIVIEYLKNHSFLDNYDFEDLFINDIVIMELYQGARNKQHDKMGYIGCAEVRSASFEKYKVNDAPSIVGTSYGTPFNIKKPSASMTQKALYSLGWAIATTQQAVN